VTSGQQSWYERGRARKRWRERERHRERGKERGKELAGEEEGGKEGVRESDTAVDSDTVTRGMTPVGDEPIQDTLPKEAISNTNS